MMRSRADHPEGVAWVDAMMAVKHQKDRLEHAYQELTRVERLRESLMQMIAHDLKNPLTAIMPWLETIQMGILTPEETAEYLQTAIDECEYLLRMIEDLNDVGKMQVGRDVELQKEPLDLAAMMQDVARRLQGRARDSGLSVHVRLPEEPLPPVPGDANKIRRVLENLVANSIKYGRPPEESGRAAEVWITAAFEPRGPEEGPSSVRVEVRDFGPGIPAAEAERVFEPYYQAEAGRKRKAGVGLGLAFSRMVVEAHGGTIWTHPNDPGGTVFAFRLPVRAG
jgi:signal transduction histidine kinase